MRVDRWCITLALLAGACSVPQAGRTGAVPGWALFDPPAPITHAIEDRGYDALHYRIEIELPHDRAEFRGAALIRLRATRPLRQVALDASDMSVLAITADARPTQFEHDRRTLLVDLGRELAAGQETTLRVQYRVVRPLGGMHFSLPSESGVADAPPHVFTQGEDLRARFWFPCFDAPHERATHELVATVPISWQALAAGRLLARTTDAAAGTATYSWSMEQEMPCYLFTLAAGPFVVIPERWDDVPVEHYVEPADLEAGRATFAHTVAVLDFLSDYTGFRYPFPKYAHVAVRDFPFGGMENVSATTVTRNSLQPASERPHGSWGLVAHEAAHQWFGDVVTCETWPHIWLNEGFATYFTNLYERHAFGEDAFLYGIGRTMDGYMDACRGDQLRALVKLDYRLPMDLFFDGTVYPGGASRLQLLRGILGEDTFRAGIRRYLERNAFQSVDTAAFASAMSEASGRDLSDWFALWVHAPGYPELDVSWSLDATGDARVELRQVQGAPGVPSVFNFPLEVRWSEDGATRVHRLEVDERSEAWTMDLGVGFEGFLEFDPQVWVPARWVVREEFSATLARARQAASARVRALACRDLAAAGGAEALVTLLEVARRDAVPALRAEAAQLAGPLLALADLPQAHAALAAESDLEVRAAWWRQLERFAGQPSVGEAMRRRIDERGAPQAERQSALRGLASQMVGADLRAFLGARARDAAESTGLRATAIALLAERLPDDGTLQLLLPLSWSGHVTEIRIAALRALRPWLAQAAPEDVGAMGVVDAYRNALRSLSASLRRAAAEGAGAHPRWFEAEIRDLMRREPDARIRRLIESDYAQPARR